MAVADPSQLAPGERPLNRPRDPEETTEEYRARMIEMAGRGGKASGEARKAAATLPPHPPEPEADPADTIRLMMSVQRQIALGQGKPRPTPAQQTQAARAWAELRIQLVQAETASDQRTFDLSLLTDRLDVLRWVARATPLQLDALRGWLEEGQRQQEEAHPRESESRAG